VFCLQKMRCQGARRALAHVCIPASNLGHLLDLLLPLSMALSIPCARNLALHTSLATRFLRQRLSLLPMRGTYEFSLNDAILSGAPAAVSRASTGGRPNMTSAKHSWLLGVSILYEPWQVEEHELSVHCLCKCGALEKRPAPYEERSKHDTAG